MIGRIARLAALNAGLFVLVGVAPAAATNARVFYGFRAVERPAAFDSVNASTPTGRPFDETIYRARNLAWRNWGSSRAVATATVTMCVIEYKPCETKQGAVVLQGLRSYACDGRRLRAYTTFRWEFADARTAAIPSETQVMCGTALTPAGRVGGFRVGVSTEQQVRAAYGAPLRRTAIRGGGTKPIGHQLEYRCGDVGECSTTFAFPARTGRLSDFSTSSPSYRTDRRTTIGMFRDEAERREGARMVSSCLDSITRSSSRARLEVSIGGSSVNRLIVTDTRHSIITC